MKNKIGLFGTVGLGILALVIRIVEYFITLDQEGYYLAVSAASVWSTVRIAVLIVGLLLSLICYAGQRSKQSSRCSTVGIGCLASFSV